MNLSERRQNEEFSKPPKLSEDERKRLLKVVRKLLSRFRAEEKSNAKTKD